MTYKSILVYADDAKTAPERLDVAARLARSHGAHLVALHVKSPPFVPADVGAGIPVTLIQWQETYGEEQAVLARKEVDGAARRNGQDIEWRLINGDPGAVTTLHSRYADLTIVSQAAAEPAEATSADELPETLVMASGRPVLIVPRYGRYPTMGERVLVAWNGTRESTRAVHDALPLLTAARAVTILEVNPAAGAIATLAGADLAAHLARHGVRVGTASTVAEDIGVADVLLSRVADLGADLLVMGAYGHSRLREYTLGGATLHVLRHMTVPVLMAH
jgi:nucleotide-binding universal stress UspA family protein